MLFILNGHGGHKSSILSYHRLLVGHMVLGLFISQDAGGVVGVEDGDGFIAIQ